MNVWEETRHATRREVRKSDEGARMRFAHEPPPLASPFDIGSIQSSRVDAQSRVEYLG